MIRINFQTGAPLAFNKKAGNDTGLDSNQ